MKTGAVIVTYNSAAYLKDCVKSLRENGIDRIVVIDNNSSDESCSLAKSLAGVEAVCSPANKGFGAACNTGALKLNTELILFINPDARLKPGSLFKARRAILSSPDIAAAGLHLLDESGNPEPDNFGPEPTLTNLFLRKLHIRGISDLRSCSWVSAGAMLVRREAFEQVGGFDPSFFLYWEDVDLCRRFREKGFKIAFVPQAQVNHVRGASQGGLEQKTRRYDAAADRYYRKHYAKPIWITQRILRKIYRFCSPLAR